MATYQEQIEQSKRHKEGAMTKTLVDLAMLTEVEKAASLLVELKVISAGDRIVLMKKYVNDRPNIRKHFEQLPKE